MFGVGPGAADYKPVVVRTRSLVPEAVAEAVTGLMMQTVGDCHYHVTTEPSTLMPSGAWYGDAPTAACLFVLCDRCPHHNHRRGLPDGVIVTRCPPGPLADEWAVIAPNGANQGSVWGRIAWRRGTDEWYASRLGMPLLTEYRTSTAAAALGSLTEARPNRPAAPPRRIPDWFHEAAATMLDTAYMWMRTDDGMAYHLLANERAAEIYRQGMGLDACDGFARLELLKQSSGRRTTREQQEQLAPTAYLLAVMMERAGWSRRFAPIVNWNGPVEAIVVALVTEVRERAQEGLGTDYWLAGVLKLLTMRLGLPPRTERMIFELLSPLPGTTERNAEFYGQRAAGLAGRLLLDSILRNAPDLSVQDGLTEMSVTMLRAAAVPHSWALNSVGQDPERGLEDFEFTRDGVDSVRVRIGPSSSFIDPAPPVLTTEAAKSTRRLVY